ncbi:MAG TPA: RHS repeat-associated core domain-containing protein [Candidatus Binatia bacterium]|jgi:RHS repeat-associated protein|nr:RHS repeat-associated core domain-containing protein [Candidatus Binatia bacterium]
MNNSLLLTVAIATLPLAVPESMAQINRQPTTWQKWVQNPPTVPVSVSIPVLYAESNSMVQITLADGLTVGYGNTNGCSALTNAPTLFANLNVRREYLLTVVTTNLAQIEMDLSVRPPLQLLSKTGSDAVPKAYAILINRQVEDIITANTNCTAYSNSWIIEIQDQQGARWLVDDQSNDPKPAPGDARFLQMGPAKSLLTNKISIEWGVSLGRLYDGLAAGRLRLSESGLSRDACTPSAIFFAAASTNVRSQVELVAAKTDGSLRRVKDFQTFVDIIDPWTFLVSDIADLPSLANRLKTETTGVSLFVSNNLAPATQQALTNYLGAGSPAEPLRSLLVHDFNTLIAGPSIYETARFTGVTLSDETQFLLAQNPQGRDLFRLNRLLLQDAYPTQLAKRPFQTALNFYLPSQVTANTNQDGVYTNITGSCFVSWLVQNPSPTTLTNLLLIECRNGLNRTNSLVFNPQTGTDNWTLTCGTGAVQRVEARGISIVCGSSTNRFETNTIHYAGNTSAYKCIENYQLFDWGWELVQTRVDPDGANLVSSFGFYQDKDDDLTYGKPSTNRYPDGDWEVRLYSHTWDHYPGSLQYVLRPFNGEPQDPADATPNNCEAAYYTPWSDGSTYSSCVNHSVNHAPNGSFSPGLLFTEYVVGGTFNGAQSDTLREGNWRVNYNCGSEGFGNTALRGSEALGKGLAGHEFFSADGQSAWKAFYYHGGVFDPATRTFTMGAGNIADGPDWRQSIVLWGQYNPQQPGDILHVDTLEGQPLWDGLKYSASGADLCPNRTQKQTTVFQNGSPVQSESAVFTGSDSSGDPVFEVFQRYAYKNDSLGHATNISVVDVSNPTVVRTVYEANYRDPNAMDGELLRWETDETGTRTEYSYDSLKRVVQLRKVGITNSLASVASVVTTTTYDAYGRQNVRTVAGGTLALTNSWSYDLAGRLVQQVSDTGLTTNYTYSFSGAGAQIVTTTLSSGATIVREQYIDRRLKSQTGTGVVAEFHTYATNDDSEIRLLDTAHWGTSDSPRWTATGNNIVGVQTFARSPDFDGVHYVERQTWYGTFVDKPIHLAVTGKASATYYIDFDDRVTYASQGDASYYLSRATRTWNAYFKIAGQWFRTQTNLTYLTDGSDTPTVASIRFERMSGFISPSTLSEVSTLDADTNLTVVTTYVDRSAKKVTQVTDTAQSALNATNVTVNGLLITESTTTVPTPTRHWYDALGRETSVTSPLGFTASHAYNEFGQITNETDFTGLRTTYEYYPNGSTGAGQLKSMSRRGKATYYSYTTRGELYHTWGDVPYPEERVYSQYGELVELHTFRSGSGWNQPTWPASPGSFDKTTWTYQDASGLLLSKTDNNGKSVTYTYDKGMVHTRSWARLIGTDPVTLTYTYNGFGDPAELDYNDGTPSVQFINYNRAGLPRQIVDASGISTLSYDHASRLLATEYTYGPFAGITVTNHFDGIHGRDSLAVLGLSSSLQDNYGYDDYGRLGAVSSGNYSAAYGYLQNADLLQTTTCANNGSPVLTTTRSWEYGSRLSSIANVANATVVTSHAYLYDAIGRRFQATLEDGSIWRYDYNDRDELIGAHHYWSDWCPVAGQQYGYDYDNIGNRKTATSGGDVNGLNLRTTSYTVNGLNQYASIFTPGYKDIAGVALAGNSVTVNGGSADRKGEYFHREISIANSSTPVWQDVTNCSGGITTNGGLAFPKYNQTLTYDFDGNLTFDGIWTYEWDAENRLAAMSMTNVASITDSNRLRLEFAYDCQNRRISKTVKHWDGTSDFIDPVTTVFVYDGRNLLAILHPDLSSVTSFLWGQDLSGTIDQAGGVGGLLMVTTHTSPATNCFTAQDGNGNITALMSAADLSIGARYEYTPFGGTVRLTGPLARQNPLRFCSKFRDDETGALYYGQRYYSPALGRWIGRDFLGERAGNHLYRFVNNAPNRLFDPDGNSPVSIQTLALIGPLAAFADTLFTISSFCIPGYLPGSAITTPISDACQGVAAGLCLGMDKALGGRLLQNIGGPVVFTGLLWAGQQMGSIPGASPFIQSQSFACAVVSGRLEALSAIGAGAIAALKGGSPAAGIDFGQGVAQVGYSFAQDLRRDDTTQGSLDAALLGAAVTTDNALGLNLNTTCFAFDLLNLDAAAAFSDLPSYQGINAWDMADSLLW